MPLEALFRASIPWLLAILLLGITVQVSLATAGLLSSPSLLGPHRSLAPWLTVSAFVVVAVALAARDVPVAIGCGAILILFLFAGPLVRSLGVLRSLHGVNALLAFAVCLLLLRERLPIQRWPAR